MRFSAIAAKLYYNLCPGRRLEFELGDSATTGAQLFQDQRRIDFNGEMAVCVPRD